MACQNVEVPVTQYTVEVQTTHSEASWKELRISDGLPATTIVSSTLIGKTIQSVIYINGTPTVYDKYGITFTTATGTIDTSAYGAVTDELIVYYK